MSMRIDGNKIEKLFPKIGSTPSKAQQVASEWDRNELQKQKEEVVKTNSDGTTTKTISMDGIIQKEVVYKTDKNGKDQITSVTRHSYNIDKSGKQVHTTKEFVDEDGDGYSDYEITKKFVDNKLVEEKKEIEEPIETDIKERPWNKENRKMTSHEAGVYVV